MVSVSIAFISNMVISYSHYLTGIVMFYGLYFHKQCVYTLYSNCKLQSFTITNSLDFLDTSQGQIQDFFIGDSFASEAPSPHAPPPWIRNCLHFCGILYNCTDLYKHQILDTLLSSGYTGNLYPNSVDLAV